MKKAILAFGRLNPPTLAHNLLVELMAKQDGDPYLYLSHSCNPKKDPLDYEIKYEWCKKAFGNLVTVAHSNANNMYEAARELNEKGYTDLVYVCGSDRAEEAQRMRAYNGKKDKNGNLVFKFNSIEFLKAGNDRVTESDDIDITKVSASRQRALAADGDLEEFMQGCPPRLTDDEKEDLYNDVRRGMGLFESLEELHEANINNLTKSRYTPEVKKKLNKQLKKIDRDLEAPEADMGVDEYKQDKDDYSGLFVKQNSTQQVVYSEKDVKKLNPEKGDKIIDELGDIIVDDKQGNLYKINPTGSSILGADKFDANTTTYYQEAIYGLLLNGTIREDNLIEWLVNSDPNNRTGVFKYVIPRNKNSELFKNCWVNFVKDWKKTFIAAQEQNGKFIEVANTLLSEDVRKAVVLHPGVRSGYEKLAGRLLAGADKFDKSDVYYCVVNPEKIGNQMLALRNDVKEYVKFMSDNTDKIIGVSLKKVSGDLEVDWDIQAKDDSFFTGQVGWARSDAASQKLVFETSDGRYTLSARTNSKSGNPTLEWAKVGAKAQMGKAASAFKQLGGDKLWTAIYKYAKQRDFKGVCKVIMKVLTGKTASPERVYNMTPEGKALITKIFNLSCGFDAHDDGGNRTTAPYIKVH